MSDYQPPFHITDKTITLLAEISEQVGRITVLQAGNINPHLRRKNRIRTIHSSLAIEHNSLSLEQVTAILNGKRVLGKPNEIKEVQNAYDAYELMLTLNPSSIEDLLKAHKAMMNGLVKESGRFRSGGVGIFDGEVLIHMAPPARFVSEHIHNLFTWYQQAKLHPLIKSAIFHYEFEFIHPFSDGNGRVGRLWHSLILQRWKPIFLWLPIETLIQEKQEGYYKALNESNSLNECTPFVTFMLEVIRDALAEIIQNQKAFIPTNDGKNVGRKVAGDVGINRDTVIKILKKQPHATAKSLAEAMNLSPRQVERVLAELKKEGKIVRKGSNKSGWWEVN